MTRLAILADLHGNLPALEAVLTDLAQFQVNQIIVAGDVINWGPFSAAVTERVVREGWPVIRGNNEYYLLDYNTSRAPAEWRDPHHFPMLPWLNAQLTGRWHNIIAAWPDTLRLCYPNTPPLRVVHGSFRRNSDSIYPNVTPEKIERMLASVEEEWVIAGHTHIAMAITRGRWTVFNPGSVGVPLDGQLSASYMLLEGNEAGWTPTFRRVPFDYAPLFAEFERQRFIEHCGLIGTLVLEEFRTARLKLYPFLQWRAAQGSPAFSPQLLEAFWKIDPWEYIPEAFWLNRTAAL